ncbi:MAG TPA: hypothetical protein VFL64_06450 [Rhizobacter sp.]|nr:hypothetical protein [Rhizobacter sp.]
MHPPLRTRLLLATWLCMAAGPALAADEEAPPPPPAPEAVPARALTTAPEVPDPTYIEIESIDNSLSSIPRRIETTLDSWQEFLDLLVIQALGPNPERRYRVFGQRKTVDLGKRWTLALDERPTGRLDTAGNGIPAAGQPSRTYEILHDGNINDLRFYNQLDGAGRENGGSVVTTIAPGWLLNTHGFKLHDDMIGVDRTDGQVGLRVGSTELWVEGFARYAQLEDKDRRENWVDPKPSAYFGGAQVQWEALPGLSLTAQHQRAIQPDMLPGDERLAGPRTDFGADWRPDGFGGPRFYWREAPQLSLLSSGGLEERTTYKRVVGAEVPEGSPDGLVYAQVRHQSLVDEHDALLVVGWRHTEEFAPTWRVQTLIESGIPIAGDSAVKSNTVDVRLVNNAYPDHLFLAEVQAVRTPVLDSGYASLDYTKRITSNSLVTSRVAATATRPHDRPTDVPLNAGEVSLGWGWQEPSERHFSNFWRYTGLGRDALVEGNVQPGVADRVANILQTEFDWRSSERWSWILHAGRRWDRDDSFDEGRMRTTNVITLRPTYKLTERWDFSFHGARRSDSAQGAQNGFGAQLSVKLNHKIVLALGYNPQGFDDGELAQDDRLKQGVTARLYIPVEATLTHWLKPPAPPPGVEPR